MGDRQTQRERALSYFAVQKAPQFLLNETLIQMACV